MIDETESILIAAERDSLRASAPALKPHRPSGGIEPASNTAFPNHFPPSDFDVLGGEADEVDPISEADVYLAYGRYKQAEELIQSAIVQHPERHEYKLKLLEIYQTTDNREAFLEYAAELKAQKLDARPEFWVQVQELGRELAPDSPLFRTAPGLIKELDYLSDDLIDELKRFEIEFADPASAGDTELTLLEPDGASSPADPHASLEFDTAALTKAKRDAEPKPTAEPVPDLENLISFEFGKATRAPEAKPESTAIDDLLRGFDQASGQDSTASGREAAALGTDPEAFAFEALESQLAALEESEADQEDEAGDGYAELSDMDPVETKLDLARAYADMEDGSAAGDLLNEVLAEGNDRQKSEARDLLSQLGGSRRQSPMVLPELRSHGV